MKCPSTMIIDTIMVVDTMIVDTVVIVEPLFINDTVHIEDFIDSLGTSF